MAVQMQPSDLSRADENDIRTCVKRFVELALARDFTTLVDELATENVVFLPPDHPVCNGRAETLAYLNGYPEMKSFEAPLVEIHGRGDTAVGRGTFDITAIVEGQPTRLVGKWVNAYRKTTSGWRVTHDIWNSDAPIG